MSSPPSTDDLLHLAVAAHQGGDLRGAGRHYRAVLEREPQHPDALHLLGMLLHRLGRTDNGRTLVRSSLALEPDNAGAHSNLGLLERNLGDLDAAAQAYSQALSLDGDLVAAWSGLGLVRHLQGDGREAERCLTRAVELGPEHADALATLARVLLAQDRAAEALDRARRAIASSAGHAAAWFVQAQSLAATDQDEEALASFGEAARLAPHQPEPSLEFGNLLYRLEREREAVAVWEDGLSRHPEHAPTLANLSAASHALGDPQRAVVLGRRAASADPDLPEAWLNLGVGLWTQGEGDEAVGALQRALALDEHSAAVPAALGAVLQDLDRPLQALEAYGEAQRRAPQDVAHQRALADILRDTRGALLQDEIVQRTVQELASCEGIDLEPLAEQVAASLSADERLVPAVGDPSPAQVLEALGEPFPAAVLSRALVKSSPVELALTATRRDLLFRGHETECTPALLAATATLAMQAWLGEYAWPLEPDEEARLGELPDDPLGWTLRAACRPWPVETEAPAEAALLPLWSAMVGDARVEAALGAGLEVLAMGDDEVSARVRAQYESSPYPRWARLTPRPATPLPRVLARLFPGRQLPPVPTAPLETLVAGCGTGRHAIAVATRYADVRVLGIDLSRRSLAYAARKRDELGLENLELAQADILALGRLDRSFDLIEAIGVLHHLDEPMTGWRALVDRLRPGGWMKIALYSRRAREHACEAQALLDDWGTRPTAPSMREARGRLLALPPAHPARRILHSRDFFSLSSFRDLLLHEREHSFDLPTLEQHCRDLGLTWVGLEVDRSIPAERWAALCPDDPERVLPASWDRWEQEFPDTFAGMYTFWCWRPSDREPGEQEPGSP